MVIVLDKGVRYPFATKNIHAKRRQNGKYNDLVKRVNVTPLLPLCLPLCLILLFTIEPLTDIGKVTARILGFNDQPRLLERQLLINKKKYPPNGVLKLNL